MATTTTEPTNAAQARFDLEAALNLALEATSTGLWTWDLRTDAVAWSSETFRIHAVRPADFKGTAAAFFELVHPEDRARVEDTVRTAIAQRTLYQCDFRIVRPDGTVVPVSNRGRARYDEAGLPVTVLGTITDETQRRHAEDLLHDNAQTFASLIEHNPFGVYVVDADFRMRHMSRGAQKAFENVHPLVGRDFAEVVRAVWTEPFASEVIERFRHTLATGEPFASPVTVEQRADVAGAGAFDWCITRIVLPDGRQGVLCHFYDLSERKHLEAQLQHSELRYRALVEGTTVASWFSPPDGIQDRPPQRWMQFTGQSADQVLGTGWADAVHPDDREHAARSWMDAVARQARFFAEFRVRRHDGQWRWLQAQAFPIHDEHGTLVEWVGMNVDVTERNELQRALRDSEARQTFKLELNDRLRQLSAPEDMLFEAASRLGVVLDAWRVGYAEDIGSGQLAVTRHYCALDAAPLASHYRYADFGDAAADFMAGRTFVRHDIAADATISPAQQATYRGLQIAAMVVVPLVRGRRLRALLYAQSSRPRRWSAADIALIESVAARTWDAVERSRAETALKASESRYRTLVQNISDYAIYMLDPAGRVVEWTDGASRVLGYQPGEVLGRHASMFHLPQDAGAVERVIAEAGRTGRAEHEGWRLRKDGERLWVNEISTAMRAADGALLGFTHISRDLSERRRAEEALWLADRRKDEFLATLAHELRNPLAPLRNGLHIARLSGHADARLARTINMMDRQLAHLVRLVDDLMDVGRISSGKLELHRVPLRLSEVLAGSIESSRATIESREHDLVVDIDPTSGRVVGDADRLTQVFTNLLTNAAKYSNPGGRIRLTLRREQDAEVVQVIDNGVGIPPDELHGVFDLFSQVRQHQGLAAGGLGIGLSLVKKLVEMHGGSVQAHSGGIGHGSTFTVRLPALAADGPSEQRLHGRSTVPGTASDRDTATTRRRVLIADDNVDAASSLAQLLGALGHECRVVHDGLAALAQVQLLRPDLVVLDLGMPLLGGIEAARKLRALPGGGQLRLAALTGWGQDSDRARTLEAGFDWHFVKPIDVDALDRILSDLEPRSAD